MSSIVTPTCTFFVFLDSSSSLFHHSCLPDDCIRVMAPFPPPPVGSLGMLPLGLTLGSHAAGTNSFARCRVEQAGPFSYARFATWSGVSLSVCTPG